MAIRMTQEDWLIDYIESAFAGVSLGDGIDLYAAQSMDHYGCPEEDALSRTAERIDWRRVPAEDLSPRFWAITFLDAKGFRFYAPAIMTAIVRGSDQTGLLLDFFIWSLDTSPHGTLKDVPLRELFSQQQTAAIVRFLKYLIHNASDRKEVSDEERCLSAIQRHRERPRRD